MTPLHEILGEMLVRKSLDSVQGLLKVCAEKKASKTECRRMSCPGRVEVPEQTGQEQGNATSEVPQHHDSESHDVQDAPHAPGTLNPPPSTGLGRTLAVWDARFARACFKKFYGFLRKPFRGERAFRDTNEMLTLLCFLIVNMLPVHIFSLVIFADYMWFTNYMDPNTRIKWLGFLYYATWSFVVLYTINVARLSAALMLGINSPLIDWEGALFRRIVAPFWQGLKWTVETLWESYHRRTWNYIRGIQESTKTRYEAITEGLDERDIPKGIQRIIAEMTLVEGVQELDYRWYLHDNRRNMKNLEGLSYKCRECIAEFLIPQPAFKLNKDAIVDLYCS
jgi:hypothetical protein